MLVSIYQVVFINYSNNDCFYNFPELVAHREEGVLIRKRSQVFFSSINSRGNINNCLLRENEHENKISANQPLPETR